MADFRASAIIARPLTDVFDFAANLENAPKMTVNVVKMEKTTDGPIGVGSKFIETRNIRGKEAKAHIEITEFVPYQSYTIESSANGLKLIYRYLFHEIEEGTQVEMEAHIKTTGIKMAITRPIIVKMIKNDDGYQLNYLKKSMEEQEEKDGK
ncbi:SRPBCC family protein [Bacillus aquiflavi]|uniref:DUF3284 domain-containing protein n=1 Tax=Bacillus aquiflavi TaxID=2672567 RepID=A0A6B3VZE2_9BACI|nr:SRPBCC family protein [Bacillus aquiflavi]MBA4537420.1 SRPBCC family protein [Bacillus aquiflavi]NEY81675.1 DUF3284 domain-containing protein [Bacillus aquiflavi]UAC47982.1 SRPBCC family protein [Bacillus aquiflavi]